jgi:hypothetical protein
MFYCGQCKNCGWNTDKFAKGCEAYSEMPHDCSNWISLNERQKIEMKMKYYPTEQDVKRNTVKFVHFGGGCGKYTNHPLTKLGVL